MLKNKHDSNLINKSVYKAITGVLCSQYEVNIKELDKTC